MKHIEYRYAIYDEKGTYINTICGTTNVAVRDYLRQQGWTSISFGGVKKQLGDTLKPHQRPSKVYGRDNSQIERNKKIRHLYVIRERLTDNMEHLSINIPELKGV